MKSTTLLIALVAALLAVGCKDNPSTGERTGERIDKRIEEAREEARRAEEKLEDRRDHSVDKARKIDIVADEAMKEIERIRLDPTPDPIR